MLSHAHHVTHYRGNFAHSHQMYILNTVLVKFTAYDTFFMYFLSCERGKDLYVHRWSLAEELITNSFCLMISYKTRDTTPQPP